MSDIDLQSSELQASFALIDAFLETERKVRAIPGLSLAIIHDQELLWSKSSGFADIAGSVPATPQTLYRVASVTKLFTATMLMQLRDAGKLQLDEPLEKYLPELKVKSNFADPAPITFRQVVAHLAGLPREDSLERVYQENKVIYPSIEEIQTSLKDTELVVAPMTEKRYSNLGFALGRIAGQSYSDYVAEHILQPLGMESSGFEPQEEWPTDLQARLATPYKTPEGNEAVPSVAPTTIEQGLNPAGGLFSSVEDMARFISLQFRDGPAGGAQILKGSTLREMHSPIFLAPDWHEATGISWELGRIQAHTTIGHNGSIYGFSSSVLIMPSLKLGLALFLNTNGNPGEMNHSIFEYLLSTFNRLLQREQKIQEAPALALPPIPRVWSKYIGRYQEASLQQAFEVSLKPDRLSATIWGTEVTLLPEEEHHFRMLNGPFAGETIHFVQNENGESSQANVAGRIFVLE